MVIILSMVETFSSVLHIIMFMDNVDCNIVYFCRTVPITHSTCILMRDNCRVVSTSSLLNCFFPLVKGGIFTSAQNNPAWSCIVKPRSTRITSPGRRFCRRPQYFVKRLKLYHPILLR